MIDALLATLERDAAAEVGRIAEEGRTRAGAITAESDRRIAERRRAALGSREAERRATLARTLSDARRIARGRVLAARAELLQRLFAALHDCLPEIVAAMAYRERLAKDLPQTLAFAGEQALILRCTPDLAPVLRDLVKTNGRLRVEPDAHIAAGYRALTVDGTLEIDGTIEGAIERLRPRVAIEALAALRTAS